MILSNALWRLCLLGLATARPHVPEADEGLSLPEPPSTNASSPSTLLLGPTLFSRAPRRPAKPQPLRTPADAKAGRRQHMTFLKETLAEVPVATEEDMNVEEDIDITPSDEQLLTWTIDGIPVGATGLYFEWPIHEKRTYKMRGLTGCTATIILSEKGMWAGHHWEASKKGGKGGGSFNVIQPGSSSASRTPLDLFKKIAVDVLTELTPADQIPNRRFWKSLEDLRQRWGDPFEEGNNVDILVMTKANSPDDPTPMYKDLIEILEEGQSRAIPGADIKRETYIGDLKHSGHSKFAKGDMHGHILIQYTPYERDDKRAKSKCAKMAKAVVWAEDKPKAMIEKEWEVGGKN